MLDLTIWGHFYPIPPTYLFFRGRGRGCKRKKILQGTGTRTGTQTPTDEKRFFSGSTVYFLQEMPWLFITLTAWKRLIPHFWNLPFIRQGVQGHGSMFNVYMVHLLIFYLQVGWISLWPKPLWPMDVWAHTLGPISHLGQFHFGPNLTLDNLILVQDSLAHGH